MQNIPLHKDDLINIFKNISDGLIIANDKQIITYVNAEAEKITGWSSEEMLGNNLQASFNLMNEIYQPVLHFFLNKTLTEPFAYDGVSLLINKEGKEIQIKKSINAVHENNLIKGFTIIFKNIGEERIKDQEQQFSEKKFLSLFENSLEGIIILDDDSNIVDANPKACEIFEIQKEEFTKLQVKNIFPHRSSEEADIVWLNFLQNGSLEGYYKFNLKEGGYRFIDFKAKANFLYGLHLAVLVDCTHNELIEKKLKNTEIYLKSFFENTPQSIILLNNKFELIHWSAPAKTFFQNTQGIPVALGSSAMELFQENFKQVYKLLSEPAEKLNAFFDLKIGAHKVRFLYSILLDGKTVKGFFLSFNNTNDNEFQDVEGSRIASSDLASSEKRFKSLAENSPDIIYIIDLRKRQVIYFNRDTVFGYPSKALSLSEAWLDIVHPDDVERVKLHWNTFLNSSSATGSIEYRLKKNDSTYEWVVNRHSIVERDAQKNALYILLNITMITERKKAEEGLRESKARLTALIENTNDIIWSVDNDFNFTAMNSSFKTLLKHRYKKSIVEGDNLLVSLPPKIGLEWLQFHKRALTGERFISEFNVNGKARQLSYEISYNPVFDDRGQICGVSVFGRDITLRKAAENDIIRTNFELDSFVYRASHDLRAPLRSVLGLINIVKTEQNEQQRNLYLNLVDKSVNKLDTFIADLTNFSRNSRMDVKIENVNFTNIITESIENLKYMENAGIIDIKSELNEKFEFWSDPVRISIILQNLLSNSIKYRNTKVEKSFVHIKVNITKNNCDIIFEDNGKGIKSEYLDKIFNMFFRASADSYGSGLGLYITKQVVEKLKGTISVSSVLGSGSIFEIKLPNLYKNN